MPALATVEKSPFKGFDLSGTYACTGRDAHDGDYKATVTLALDKNNSHANYGGYKFSMKAEGYGGYVGSAAASGNVLAITFANEDPSTKDFGTGIAKVTKAKGGKVKFEKFYYEPEYKGGSHGLETCVRS